MRRKTFRNNIGEQNPEFLQISGLSETGRKIKSFLLGIIFYYPFPPFSLEAVLQELILAPGYLAQENPFYLQRAWLRSQTKK